MLAARMSVNRSFVLYLYLLNEKVYSSYLEVLFFSFCAS